MQEKEQHFTLDFVGIGVGHSGTTWLFNCINEHPEIKGSNTKETKFFRDHYEKGLNYYHQKFFDGVTEGVQGEYTPSYITDKTIAKRIYESFPDTKIIAVLRDPIEFIRSAYYFNQQRGIIRFDDLNKKIIADLNNPESTGYKIIDRADYYKHLKAYFDLFPEDNIHITFFKDIQKKPDEVISGIYEFLEVDPGFIPPSLHQKINVTAKNRRYLPFLPKLYTSIRKSLGKNTLGRLFIKLGKLIHLQKVVNFVLKYNFRETNLKPIEKETLKPEITKELENIVYKDLDKLEYLIGKPTPWIRKF